ncbi:MAG: MATE family efflux transporter [Actinomycetota bacterium]|nr:MATE family efflux transporter [Actinomycetota bacterium]
MKPRSSDHVTILAGASQNVLGLLIAGVATLGAQVLISRTLGEEAFGIVTVLTQAAFVLSFATRAGMDMAVIRTVAIAAGASREERIRAMVTRAAVIAGGVSLLAALAILLAAEPITRAFSLDPSTSRWAVQAAAVGLPFLAVTNVWLGATRGLKIMRYTLYVFWAGQPVVWIALMLLGWRISETPWMSVLAYSISWLWAAGASWGVFRRESGRWERAPLEPGVSGRLMRYAGPRAPAALFSQLVFWADLFVLAHFASDRSIGIYSGVLRTGQMVVLFLTSVNLMFSPFVADLYSRGEIDCLGRLFKSLTRWTLAATVPLFIVLAVAPGEVLDLFGESYREGRTALLILLGGQLVNIATGSAGFVLIMVGRTGWDLAVYAGSLTLNLALAVWLCPRYGIEGAAFANAATFACSNVARIVLVKRFVGIHPYDGGFARLLAPAAVGAAAGWVVHSLVPGSSVGLVLTGAAVVVAYGIAYAGVGLTSEERSGASELLARRQAR